MPDSSNQHHTQNDVKHSHIPIQTPIILVMAFIVFIFAMGSKSDNIYSAQISVTPTVTQPTGTATVIQPTPIESTDETTTGVILGGIFLLLIIIIGTLGVIRHKD